MVTVGNIYHSQIVTSNRHETLTILCSHTLTLLQEHSLTKEVIRKISPTEAQLLSDPTCDAKVRFRYDKFYVQGLKGKHYACQFLWKNSIKIQTKNTLFEIVLGALQVWWNRISTHDIV